MSERTKGKLVWTYGTGDFEWSADLHPADMEKGSCDSVLHHGADWPMKPADAAHIVACWNALEGINPEAVPGLLKAAAHAARSTHHPGCANDGQHCTCHVGKARDALAKVRG